MNIRTPTGTAMARFLRDEGVEVPLRRLPGLIAPVDLRTMSCRSTSVGKWRGVHEARPRPTCKLWRLWPQRVPVRFGPGARGCPSTTLGSARRSPLSALRTYCPRLGSFCEECRAVESARSSAPSSADRVTASLSLSKARLALPRAHARPRGAVGTHVRERLDGLAKSADVQVHRAGALSRRLHRGPPALTDEQRNVSGETGSGEAIGAGLGRAGYREDDHRRRAPASAGVDRRSDGRHRHRSADRKGRAETAGGDRRGTGDRLTRHWGSVAASRGTDSSDVAPTPRVVAASRYRAVAQERDASSPAVMDGASMIDSAAMTFSSDLAVEQGWWCRHARSTDEVSAVRDCSVSWRQGFTVNSTVARREQRRTPVAHKVIAGD